MRNSNPQLFRVGQSIEIKLAHQGNSALFQQLTTFFEEFQRNTLHTCCWRYCKKSYYWRFLKRVTRAGIDGDKSGFFGPGVTKTRVPYLKMTFTAKKKKFFVRACLIKELSSPCASLCTPNFDSSRLKFCTQAHKYNTKNMICFVFL